MEPSADIKRTDDRFPRLKKSRVFIYLFLALVLFLLSMNFMVASLKHIGPAFTELILLATSNPFTGLFIGLIVTAILQSSSTTTSIVIALTSSHAITISAAVPIIMGANIGTTITSTVVSFAFINRKKEYKRALAAGTYHDFFNILTALLLFPLEYFNGFLSNLAGKFAGYIFEPSTLPDGANMPSEIGTFEKMVMTTLEVWNYPLVLAMLALTGVFVSILVFRKISADLFLVGKPEAIAKFFFDNRLKSFLWGLGTTAAIRSSTITTSMVVPIVAKKISTLREAAPFIVGANIGTTITGFIAVILNTNSNVAMTIAIAHFLFNFVGALLFLFTPFVNEVPLFLATRLGAMSVNFRFIGLIYLFLTFFLIPFGLIFLNR